MITVDIGVDDPVGPESLGGSFRSRIFQPEHRTPGLAADVVRVAVAIDIHDFAVNTLTPQFRVLVENRFLPIRCGEEPDLAARAGDHVDLSVAGVIRRVGRRAGMPLEDDVLFPRRISGGRVIGSNGGRVETEDGEGGKSRSDRKSGTLMKIHASRFKWRGHFDPVTFGVKYHEPVPETPRHVAIRNFRGLGPAPVSGPFDFPGCRRKKARPGMCLENERRRQHRLLGRIGSPAAGN